ncbi:MAG: hypothetical protein V3S55_09740 [Nitrospiraceae bacterium]
MPPQNAKKTVADFEVPELEIGVLNLLVVGTSPVIPHAISAKNKEQIAAKQQQKGQQARGKRNPRQEYLDSFYMIKGKPETKNCVYGLPAAAFRQAMISACRQVPNLTMAGTQGCFHVFGVKGTNFVKLIDHSDPRMGEDTVTLSGPGRPLDLRYRPYFDEWSVRMEIQFNLNVISIEQLFNLAHIAGFHVGVGDHRPEKAGSNGMFQPSQKAVSAKKAA